MFGGVECAHGVSDAVSEHKATSWSPRGTKHTIKPVKSKSTLSTPPGVSAIYKWQNEGLLVFTELVTEYTKRTLSCASDGLDAFRGAANVLQLEQDPPVYNISGIPFVLSSGHDPGDTKNLAEAIFSYGLAWLSLRNLARDAASGRVSAHVEGCDFPSWSWGNVNTWEVAWYGIQCMPFKRYAANALYYPRDVKIEFTSEGAERLVELTEFADACRGSKPLSRQDPSGLCFKARMFSSRVRVGSILEFEESQETDLDHAWLLDGFGYKDIKGEGEISGLYAILAVNIGATSDDEERNLESSGGKYRMGSSYGCWAICSGGVTPTEGDVRLYEDIQSGKCGLLLLRCDANEARVLLVEWVDKKTQKSARRLGIFEFRFDREPNVKRAIEEHADEFLRCFSIERDIRLV